ncbi:MAG: 50S ribosome-binding GTPase, partial [Candidatus Riflebacteria bacterium]|nr:50S ribosome-binding GTPase [Candidatus Riflebacteria bacterium]
MEEPAAGSEFRSGFVSVLGLPNVGKSSLVNQFLGKSVCITSFKAQTSRYHIRCIATSPKRQIVFVDTPGWVKTDRLIDKLFRLEIDRGAE